MKPKKFILIGVVLVFIIGLFVTYVIAQYDKSQISIRLIEGWTLIPIFSSMAGKGLSDMNNFVNEKCKDAESDIAAWTFDNTGKSWIMIQNFGKTISPLFNPMDKFSIGNAEQSLWINTKNNCTIWCGLKGCVADLPVAKIFDDTLSEGLVKSYTVDGRKYDVMLVHTDKYAAKFTVNDDTTPSMFVNEQYVFGGNVITSSISARKIYYDNVTAGNSQVEFSLIVYK